MLTNPPANDVCTGAVVLTSGLTATQDITHATELGDATDSCGVNISHGVWYTVTPGINQRVNLSTAGSTFPTYLSVYTGTCGALTNLLCNSGGGYYGGNGIASVDFSSPGNVTYHILAGGINGSSGTLVITAMLTNPPANDVCAGAVVLTSGLTATQDITHATELGDATDSCGVNISHGVWYTVTPGINQRVNINTLGSTFPTYLAVYTGTCGALTNILCNDGGGYYGGNGLAGANFSSISNTTYHILVGGYSGVGAGTLQSRRISHHRPTTFAVLPWQ